MQNQLIRTGHHQYHSFHLDMAWDLLDGVNCSWGCWMAIPCQKRLGQPLISPQCFWQRLPKEGYPLLRFAPVLQCPVGLLISVFLLFFFFLLTLGEICKRRNHTASFSHDCLRKFLFLFPLPHFLLNPHGFSWVVDILRVDGSLLVSVLLLLLGVVHHHVVLEDEAEVDWLVVRPGERRGTV